MTISIVIPCYNHGHYIREAVDSVLEVKGVDYEIVIVNDGSTDQGTISRLQELEAAGLQVITQPNSGLARARNRGIEAATGKYILPLDADNKIKPEYVYTALRELENGFDIAYAKPVFFGNVTTERLFVTRPFNLSGIAAVNYIDACAVYRKEIWKQLNGYDADMPYPGQEDWEFWIHAFAKGYKFKFIDEALFYYRIENNSMIASTMQPEKSALNLEYIIAKHRWLFTKLMVELIYSKKMHDNDVKNPLRSFFKYVYYNVFKRSVTPPGSLLKDQ